jgi:predicted N-acetyltransferase YhbS
MSGQLSSHVEGEKLTAEPVHVRPLRDDDVDDADRIMRKAFGTFLGFPDPLTFGGDAEAVRFRARCPHVSAFVAEKGKGRIVGSSFVARWGSFAVFGPLTVEPACWEGGVGSRLMEPVVDQLADWDVRLTGLFTFPQSVKHVGLYQKFGFYPRTLAGLMTREVTETAVPPTSCRLSGLSDTERVSAMRGMADVAGELYDGLDLTGEAEQVLVQDVGDVVTVLDPKDQVSGFAVCHQGPGSESGTGTCYVKFGCVRPGASASDTFSVLLDAVEALAHSQGAATVLVGGNTARQEAYEALLARGYRVNMYGLSMHRPNGEGFTDRDSLVIDDWR